MKRGVVLRRLAEKEFESSIAFYENQRQGLGQEFRAAIEQYYQRIAWKPFGIVSILSVFHTSRDPEQLKYR